MTQPDNSTADAAADVADILLFYPGAYREPFLPELRHDAAPAPVQHTSSAFSAAELDVITKLTALLDPELRDPFRRALAALLARYRPAEISPGLVRRIGRELQGEFSRASAARDAR